MTTQSPEPTATIEKLTDEAIKKERAKFQRMIVARQKSRDELDAEIRQLQDKDTELLTVQIERLTAQLPSARAELTAKGNDNG